VHNILTLCAIEIMLEIFKQLFICYIGRIKRIKTEVEQRTLALKKRQELKDAKREEKMKKPKKLGKYKYPCYLLM